MRLGALLVSTLGDRVCCAAIWSYCKNKTANLLRSSILTMGCSRCPTWRRVHAYEDMGRIEGVLSFDLCKW